MFARLWRRLFGESARQRYHRLIDQLAEAVRAGDHDRARRLAEEANRVLPVIRGKA